VNITISRFGAPPAGVDWARAARPPIELRNGAATRAALEVVALGDFLAGLIDRVIDFLDVDA
jgi:hypothetical protein